MVTGQGVQEEGQQEQGQEWPWCVREEGEASQLEWVAGQRREWWQEMRSALSVRPGRS